MKKVITVERIMKKYLILFTIIALLAGIFIGYRLSNEVMNHRALLRDAIIVMAILALTPSMIRMRLKKIGKALKNLKVLIITSLLSLLLTPILSMAIAEYYMGPLVGAGYLVTNIVPASSASIGYVLLAGGDIEIATSLLFITILGSLIIDPLYIEFFKGLKTITIPIYKITISMIIALIVPIIIGQTIRRYILSRRDADMSSITPYLSITTMVCMLSLVFLLTTSKATIIVERPIVAITVIAGQTIIMLTAISILWIITKITKINYSEHVAIAYISITKNNSAAAIISAVALGGAATIAPAMVPIIQPLLCILYLHILARTRMKMTWQSRPCSATYRDKYKDMLLQSVRREE